MRKACQKAKMNKKQNCRGTTKAKNKKVLKHGMTQKGEKASIGTVPSIQRNNHKRMKHRRSEKLPSHTIKLR